MSEPKRKREREGDSKRETARESRHTLRIDAAFDKHIWRI